jgi:hypothetical protein
VENNISCSISCLVSSWIDLRALCTLHPRVTSRPVCVTLNSTYIIHEELFFLSNLGIKR